MQVDAGEFIDKLRERFALKIEGDDHGILAAFDRSCVEVLVDGHEKAKNGLTPGQKAAATRAKNKAERLREAEAAAPVAAAGGE